MGSYVTIRGESFGFAYELDSDRLLGLEVASYGQLH